MNQSLKPKATFHSPGGFAKSLEALVVNPGFRDACQAALLSHLMSLPKTKDMVEAAANWHRMEGAMDAIDTLLNLAEVPKPPEQRSDYNLKS